MIILVVGISVIAVSLNTPISNQIAFSIISPNPQENTVIAKNQVCFAKTETKLFENTARDGKRFIRSENSPFLIDNPMFTLNSITDIESGESLKQFEHLLKIRCNSFTTSTDATSGKTFENQQACEDPSFTFGTTQCELNDTKILFRPSIIEVEVWATDTNGLDKRLFIQSFQTVTVEQQFGAEVELLLAEFPIQDLLEQMDNGDYTSSVEFRTSGILNLSIGEGQITPGIIPILQFYIGKLDIPTNFELDIFQNVVGTVGNTDPDDPEIIEEMNKEQEEIIQMQEDEKQESINNSGGTQNLGDQKEQNLGDQNGDPPDDNEFAQTITDLGNCIIGLDINCLNDSRFLGFFAIGFIFGLLIFIAILAKMFRGARPIQ